MVAFDWDEANLEHIEKHGFTPEDAEEAILDPDRQTADAGRQGGERRYAIIGRGSGGHILHVAFVIRDGKVRPFHCREANPAEKRRYRR